MTPDKIRTPREFIAALDATGGLWPDSEDLGPRWQLIFHALGQAVGPAKVYVWVDRDEYFSEPASGREVLVWELAWKPQDRAEQTEFDHARIRIDAQTYPDGKWRWGAQMEILPPDPAWSSARASSALAEGPHEAMERMIENWQWLGRVGDLA